MSKQTIQPEFQDDVAALVAAHRAEEASSAASDTAMAVVAQWIASGVHPNNATIIAGYVADGRKASSAATYASALLKWVKAGRVPRNYRAAVTTNPPGHVKGARGRPANKGKGKSTAADATPAEKTPTIPSDDRTWKQVLEGMIARVPSRKDWASEDIVAFQDCASKMIALLKRNAK